MNYVSLLSFPRNTLFEKYQNFYFRKVKRIKFLLRYFQYLLNSKNAHGVHSPFVYDLVTEVIYKDCQYYTFLRINQLRSQLEKDFTEIDVKDFGAGSYHSNLQKKKIGEIYKSAAKSKKYGELLFRLTNRFSPKTILELGTSLGISAIYLASACKQANLVTIEASEEISKHAKNNFQFMKLVNATIVTNTFENALSSSIQKLGKLDLVFFDGNHRKEPTLKYFEECLLSSHNESVFILDDIYWSDEMAEAWKEIKAHPQVTVTIDLFFIGLVFFRKQQVKEHFVIRY